MEEAELEEAEEEWGEMSLHIVPELLGTVDQSNLPYTVPQNTCSGQGSSNLKAQHGKEEASAVQDFLSAAVTPTCSQPKQHGTTVTPTQTSKH